MRNALPVTLTAAAALLAAACTTTEADGQSGPSLPDKPTTSVADSADGDEAEDNKPTSGLNERGNLVKKLGEEAGYGSTDPNDPGNVTFTIDKVEVDPPCDEFGEAPEAGHTLLLHLRVATGSDPQVATMLPALFYPGAFSALTNDGVTKPAELGMCTGFDDQMPMQYGTAQKYTGTIELVVPEASGTLIMNAAGMSQGWEWEYDTEN